MPRTVFPRSRGGRGPQVGPGTFEVRSESDITAPRPDRFEAMVWSPGASVPDVELWAVHISSSPFKRIDPSSVDDDHDLYIDKVPTASAFSPTNGSAPDSPATIAEFRQYAVDRYEALQGPTSLSEWKVQTSRPFPGAPTNGPNLKVAPYFYSVAQRDRPTGTTPLAWAYVFPSSDGGSQEMWALWRFGEPDGFAHVGRSTPGSSIPYDSTILRYKRLPDLFGVGAVPTLTAIVDEMKLRTTTTTDTPVYDMDQLEIHHFRNQISF